MRRLLAYIVILTGVLSAAINAGSTWAYTHPNPAACLFIRSRKGFYAFDIATGKILGLSNGVPVNRAISNGGEIVPNGNYSLYDEKETTTIYLQTPFEERRKIQENAWLQTFAWSPNKALVAYLWSDNIGNYSITILNLKSGETYTIPIKPTVAKGFFHWTADNQTLVYKFEDLSITIDPDQRSFRENLRTGSKPLVSDQIFWSPSGYLVAFKSNKNSWTIENADGSNPHDYTFDISTNSPRTIDYPRDWSPDGRILIFEGQEADVERGLVSHILIDTLSGKMEKIDFNGYQYWQFIANTHNMIFAGYTRLYLYDPITKSQSTIFSGGDLIEFMPSMNLVARPGVGFSPPSGLYRIFDDNLLYIVSQLETMEIRQFNLKTKKQEVILTGKRIHQLNLNDQNIAIAGQQVDKNSIFILYDAVDGKRVFEQTLPGTQISMRRLTKNSSWMGINTQIDTKTYGWLINTNTGELRDVGEGKFESLNDGLFFTQSNKLAFLSSKPGNMVEYQLFDREANVEARYLLPEPQPRETAPKYFPKGKTSTIIVSIKNTSPSDSTITNYRVDGSTLWQRQFTLSVQTGMIPLECDGKGIAWDR